MLKNDTPPSRSKKRNKMIYIIFGFFIFLFTAYSIYCLSSKIPIARSVNNEAIKVLSQDYYKQIYVRKSIFGKIGGYQVVLKENGATSYLDCNGQYPDYNIIWENHPGKNVNIDGRRPIYEMMFKTQFPIKLKYDVTKKSDISRLPR